MRAGAEIHKLSLIIERNLRILRQILDQLKFVILATAAHEINRFLPGDVFAHHRLVLRDNPAHFLLDFDEIFVGKPTFDVEIIVEAVVDGRPNGQFCLRVQALYRLSQNVAGRMAQCAQTFRVLRRQNLQRASIRQYGIQIRRLSIYPGRQRSLCQLA